MPFAYSGSWWGESFLYEKNLHSCDFAAAFLSKDRNHIFLDSLYIEFVSEIGQTSAKFAQGMLCRRITHFDLWLFHLNNVSSFSFIKNVCFYKSLSFVGFQIHLSFSLIIQSRNLSSLYCHLSPIYRCMYIFIINSYNVWNI